MPSAEFGRQLRMPKRTNYLEQLALRRQDMAIRRHIVYGLVMGWILALGFGFLFFCAPSRVLWLDRLWASLAVLGVLHLAAAVVVPQALYWPERAWTAITRWQGWLVMRILLTLIYFGLLWPASYFSRRRTRGFVTWRAHVENAPSAWQSLDVSDWASLSMSHDSYRSLPMLFASVIGFFFRRGDIVLVLIVMLLVVMGLILYFVESTVVAPFIYTLF